MDRFEVHSHTEYSNIRQKFLIVCVCVCVNLIYNIKKMRYYM